MDEEEPGNEYREAKPGSTATGPLFPEPVQVIVCTPLGASVKLVGKGLDSERLYELILDADPLASLVVSPDQPPFDTDAVKFRLEVEALRQALAYEYAPYFSLSITRVDPPSLQPEAVYDRFIKLPRIRFLLADDPGAGKTIMAGLLLKELKIRGPVKRTLIVTPANLTFQWQRELKDKFRKTFEIIRGDESAEHLAAAAEDAGLWAPGAPAAALESSREGTSGTGGAAC